MSKIQFPGQFGYTDADGNPHGPSTSVGFSTERISGNPLRVWVGLTNTTQALFPSLAVPGVLNLANFPLAQLEVSELIAAGATILYAGTTESLREIPIQEPASAIRLCLAAMDWFARPRDSQVSHA